MLKNAANYPRIFINHGNKTIVHNKILISYEIFVHYCKRLLKKLDVNLLLQKSAIFRLIFAIFANGCYSIIDLSPGGKGYFVKRKRGRYTMQLNFQAHKDCCNYEEICEPHFHDEYEILLCLSDGGTFLINSHTYPLCRGMLFILGRGVLHQCIANIASYEKYILHFSSDTLWSVSSPQTDFQMLFNGCDYFAIALSNEQFETLCRQMEECIAKDSGFGSDMRQNIAFMQLVLYVSNLMRCNDPAAQPIMAREYAKIMPIIEFVHKNYAENISLEQISQQFFISKYYLCRQFKKVTGFSVGAYITNYRIRQACALLRQGASVQEAGEDVGFGNTAHFIRTFGQIVGASPGKYAKTY